MLVLGLSGGIELIHENLYGSWTGGFHDSASVLLEDGKVVAAIEEERLNRIKHTNKFASQSLRFCLESRGIQLHEVDLIAFYVSKNIFEGWAKFVISQTSQAVSIEPIKFFQNIFHKALNCDIEPEKFYFVPHHYAHAMSASALSGYENSLVAVFDGQGEDSSGMVFKGEGTTLEQIADIPVLKSLGYFYDHVIAVLGYGQFDEYKVMGLAPYGDPKTFRDLFKTFYTLLPQGDYIIHQEKIASLFNLVGLPRRKGEPFTQTHKDIAASLQEALENILFHVLDHYQRETKQKNLCMAGGVAHNCTFNGKILRSGMFENVFVQPAAHDAGCALGADSLCILSSESKTSEAL